MPTCVILKYKGAEAAAVGSSIQTTTKQRSINLSPDTNYRNQRRNMHLSSIPLCGLVLILNLQLFSTYPISTGLTDTDMDILKVLLHRLEESVSEQTDVDQRASEEQRGLDNLNGEEAQDGWQSQTGLDEAAIREFLSAKNLKSVRNDPSRRSSGCFGRRMDRIGSMSSLGCNTVGRNNPK